jgi:uncharacterized RDD family membrane protein YckC
MDSYTENQNQQTETSHLSTELFELEKYTDASQGQRFVNWLVDNILMQYGLSYLTGTLVGIIIASAFPDYARKIAYEQTGFDIIILGYSIAIFNYLLYYTLSEKAFKGYTLGKLFSGTRAIRNDGQELTIKDAFLRSLSRLVPFEAFSALGGTPWHDRWTNTRVIKSR